MAKEQQNVNGGSICIICGGKTGPWSFGHQNNFGLHRVVSCMSGIWIDMLSCAGETDRKISHKDARLACQSYYGMYGCDLTTNTTTTVEIVVVVVHGIVSPMWFLGL